MSRKEKIVHKITVNSGASGMVVPRRGSFALRRSRLIRRRIRLLFYIVGFVFSFAAIGQAGYGFLMEAPIFMVKQPKIEGVSPALKKEILGLVDSLTRRNHNLLSISASDLETQISRHPRLRDVRVEKIYPDQLVISAIEREEVAIAQTGNGFYLLDNHGHVMDKLELEDLSRLKYPFISGIRTEEVHEGEPVNNPTLHKALNLLQVLAARNKPLYERISELQIKSDGVSALETLTAHLKSGLDIKFGDSNPVDKLAELETLIQKLKSEGTDPFSKLVYIDMSFDDMAYCMDRETALFLAQNKYSEVEQRMQEAKDKYAKNHANDSDNEDLHSSDEDETPNRRVSHESKESNNSNRAATPRRAYPRQPRRAAPAQPNYNYGYQNYRAAPRQYPAQRYYQPRQPRQQSQPLYNLPANQQRY